MDKLKRQAIPRNHLAAIVTLSLISSSFGLLAPRAVHAQTTCNAAPFLAVSSWTGTVSITGTGSGTLTDSQGNVFTYNVHQSIQLGPVLTASQTDPSKSTGPENATFNVNDTWTSTQPGFPTSTTVVTASGTTAMGFFNDGAGLSISSLPIACGYSFGADDTTSSYTVTVDGQSGQTTELNWGATNIPNFLVPPGTPTSPQTFVPFPTSGKTLSGRVSFSGPSWDIPSDFPNNPGPVINWTITWSFSPTPRPLDLLVSIPQYNSWRPSAGRSETDINVGPNSPANLLEIKAQLVFKDDLQPTPFAPDKITFTIAGVSREPGVVLNWPPQDKLVTHTPPDLSFVDLSGKNNINPDYIPNADGTQAVETPSASDFSPVFDILLVPYDWGAWATLQVVAEVAGQPAPIQGRLILPMPPGGAIVTDILLPKRQPGSFIADSWKMAHHVALTTPDNDDSESNPIGDGNKGDGFTLYEEYRGFYMGCALNSAMVKPEGTPGAICKHVEGDPAKKDLFIVSYLSSQQNIGIIKFKQVTKLNVHYKGLSQQEIAPDRLINFNYAQGPHLKNSLTAGQHALYIHWDSTNGDFSVAVGGPGVPRKIEQILINYNDEGLINPQPGPHPGDNYFTSTVAHELGHSVNVWHHGESDERSVHWYADNNGQVWETSISDSNGNPAGGVKIGVFHETEDPRQGAPIGPAELGLLQGCPDPVNNCPCPQKDDSCAPDPAGIEIYVGNRVCSSVVMLGGQHSGDDKCLMRYDAASAYIPNKHPNVRYWPVDEATAYGLTHTIAGTGVNDATTHETGLGLLSRYGDAYGAAYGDSNANHQRGDCLGQIDVNDLMDPPTRDAPSKCPK
jgi:hypothetical protein